MSKSLGWLLLPIITFCLAAPAANAQAGEANADVKTAGSGDQGVDFNNLPSNDSELTQREAFPFLIAPADTGQTVRSNKTKQSTYQALTQQRAQTGLLAPLSTLQFGDTFPFGSQFNLGFPGPSGPTWAGRGWNYGVPFVPITMPTVGTGSVDADVTIGGGY